MLNYFFFFIYLIGRRLAHVWPLSRLGYDGARLPIINLYSLEPLRPQEGYTHPET